MTGPVDPGRPLPDNLDLSGRVAVVTGGSLRVNATRPEWILGAGQKTFMPMTPALRMLLYQAALTEGTP